MEIWPFRPNWGQDVLFTHTFNTSIFESRSGKEQRRLNRRRPRLSLEYTYFIENEEKQRLFERFVYSNQNKTIAVPDFTRYFELTEDEPENSRFVELPDEYPLYWARPNSHVVLMDRYYQKKERRIVEAIINGDVLQLPEADIAFSKGDLCMFCFDGLMEEEHSVNCLTDHHKEGRMVFEMRTDYDYLMSFKQPSNFVTMYKDRPVIIPKMNWGVRPVNTYIHPLERVSYGVGIDAMFNIIENPKRLTRATFSAVKRDTVEFMRGLFYWAKGRLVPFFVSTGQPDILIYNPLISGANYFVVEGRDIYDNFNNSDIYKYLIIRLKDGTSIIRKVTALEVYLDNLKPFTTVRLDGVWSRSYDLSEIAQTEWLLHCRFGSDVFIEQWVAPNVCDMSLTFQSLEAPE